MLPIKEGKYWFDLRKDYLYMKVTGKYNSLQFLDFPELILEECKKTKSNKVVVDGLEVDYSNLSTMERYFMGEEFAKVVSYKVAIAIVAPAKIITKFMETVAANRGATVHVTSNIKAAETWLEQHG